MAVPGSRLVAAVILAAVPAAMGRADPADLTLSNDLRLAVIGPTGGGGYGYARSANPASTRLDWHGTVTIGDDDLGLTLGGIGWWDPDRGQVVVAGTPIAFGRYPEGVLYDLAPSRRHGEIDLAEAVIHDRISIDADQSLSLRVGRDVLVWGESLYFTDNGIAGGQVSIDRRPLDLSPDYGGRDRFEPIGQGALVWQIGPGFAIEAYDQFEYRPDRFNGPSGEFAVENGLGPGSRTVLNAGLLYDPAARFSFGTDSRPDGADRFGLAVRGQMAEVDWGFYGLRFDAKTPIPEFRLETPVTPLSANGRWDQVYPTGIDLYGLSAATSLGAVSVAGEISLRRNMPLASLAVVLPDRDPVGAGSVPRGETLHGSISWTLDTGPLPGLPDGAAWNTEIAGHGLLEVTANPDQVMPGRSRWALALRTVFEPRLYQVMPRVDLTLPIGLGYDPLGRSPLDPAMNRGTGEVSVGLGARVDSVWRVALGATHYIGRVPPMLVPAVVLGAEPTGGYGDYAGLSLERRF